MASSLLAAAVAASLSAQAPKSTTVDIPHLAYEKYALSNGLTVILNPEPSTPIVTVDMWYHVGSKNELPGRTGFAHLFEHMMFEGSENIGQGQHRIIIQSVGGSFNGSTTEDRTNYFETVPSNQLETALWMESDRMATLLTRLNQERLDAEREIVKNERRLRVDNQPFGSQVDIMTAALFPTGHPYSWPVIGSMADLSAASLDDVKGFFRQYYVPNNATITISGDIDPAKTKALVAKYFGEIPRGTDIKRPAVPAVTLPEEKRLALEDTRARTPLLLMAWPTVGMNHKDRTALVALAAVLTTDRTSRLRKLLVFDKQLATNVFSFNNTFEDGGYFQISVTPRPGASLTEIERLTDSVLTTVKSGTIADAEVQRARNYNAVNTVSGLQFSLGRAEPLADGQVFHRDANTYAEDLKRAASVTPADVQRVARQYLTGGRVVLSMVPAGKLDQVSKPDAPYTNMTPRPTGN